VSEEVKKPTVKMVVIVAQDSPMLSETLASVGSTLQNEEIMSAIAINQTSMVGRTSLESLVRGVYSITPDAGYDNVVNFNYSSLKEDIIVIVKNGVNFVAENVAGMLSCLYENNKKIVVCNMSRDKMWCMENSEGARYGALKPIPNGVQASIAEFGLAAMTAETWNKIVSNIERTDAEVFDRKPDSATIEFFDFDKRICMAAGANDVEIKICDEVVEFIGAADIHKSFHTLLNDAIARQELVDPRNITIKAGDILSAYSTAVAKANVAEMNAAVIDVIKVVLDVFQKTGMKIDTEGVSGDIMLAIATGAPEAHSQVVEETVAEAVEDNTVEFDKK